MAVADVDIANLALSLVGDAANVSSINPPDQSRQAQLAAKFYPIARDAMLELHNWGFAMLRVQLALAPSNPSSSWQYAYYSPSNVLNYIAITDPNAPDDNAVGIQLSGTLLWAVGPQIGVVTPQPFVVETDITGDTLILTNQANAVLRYTESVTDTSKFSPLFVEGLAMLLAAKLAGPLIKGEEGRSAAIALLGEFKDWLGKAAASDSNQRRLQFPFTAPWVINR